MSDQPPYDPRIPKEFQGLAKIMDQAATIMNTQSMISLNIPCTADEGHAILALLKEMRARPETGKPVRPAPFVVSPSPAFVFTCEKCKTVYDFTAGRIMAMKKNAEIFVCASCGSKYKLEEMEPPKK